MPKSYIGGFQKVSKNRGSYDEDDLPNKKKNKPNRGNKRSQILPIQDANNNHVDSIYEDDTYDNEY